jgi:hypothetical protein
VTSVYVIYIVGFSVFWGEKSLFLEIHSFSHVQKGLYHLRKDDYYLICRQHIVKGFYVLYRVFVVERVGCQARENSLQVRYLLSKRRFVCPLSILSR